MKYYPSTFKKTALSLAEVAMSLVIAAVVIISVTSAYSYINEMRRIETTMRIAQNARTAGVTLTTLVADDTHIFRQKNPYNGYISLIKYVGVDTLYISAVNQTACIESVKLFNTDRDLLMYSVASSADEVYTNYSDRAGEGCKDFTGDVTLRIRFKV